MKVLTYLDDAITKALVEEQEKKQDRIRSGKMSAGLFGLPTLWQLLRVHGVSEPIDPYTLRKFARGNQVEWFVTQYMEGIKQGKIEYKNCVGYCDNILNNVPDEVKSVTGMKFRRIWQSKSADIQHRLQATYYALGLKSDIYNIHYVASDDLRVYSLEYDIDETKDQVEQEIETFHKYFENKTLPKFEPKLEWHKLPKYQSYQDWNNLSESELKKKLEKFLEGKEAVKQKDLTNEEKSTKL